MIIDLQRRLAEVGRIRIGMVVSAGRATRPEKLTTFRLTSPDKTRIDAAAKLYGGTPQQWEAPSGQQWEVITTADTLHVVVPPSDMAFSQFYELWSGGGCQRRCDGVNESISDGPCLCDPDNRDCKIHTRLSVMLRDLPGLGVWRIDSSGYYAGVELQGAVEIVKLAAARSQMLPAVLRLEQRMVKRANESVKRFAVPVLDLMISPAQLLGVGDTLAIETDVTDGGQPANLTPVPESVPQRPQPSVAEQAAPPKAKKPRKNAAKKIPPTKVVPRTAAQAAKQAPPPDEPPQEDPWGPPPPPDPDERAKHHRQMHALFRNAGLGDDRRNDRMTVTRYISKRFDIGTSNDLTDPELADVCNRLSGWERENVLATKVADILNEAALDEWQQQQEAT